MARKGAAVEEVGLKEAAPDAEEARATTGIHASGAMWAVFPAWEWRKTQPLLPAFMSDWWDSALHIQTE